MAIRAGSGSLFGAHTPSGCPQHLHLPFKAFQGRGCLTHLRPLVPKGLTCPHCPTSAPSWSSGKDNHPVYMHLPTVAHRPPGKQAQSRQAVTLPPDGHLEPLDTGLSYTLPCSTRDLFSQVLQVSLRPEDRCHQTGSAEQGLFCGPTAGSPWG